MNARREMSIDRLLLLAGGEALQMAGTITHCFAFGFWLLAFGYQPAASSEPPALQSNQIQFDFFVALSARPDVERCARDLVDQRHRDAEPCEINGFQIAL